MDKYEFNIKVEQLKKLAKSKDYKTAMKIADSIDWRRVHNSSLLSLVSEIYENVHDYSEAKEILLLAFERVPVGKHLLYRLTALALKEGNIAEAEAYYNEFHELAPEDSRAYLLRYLIMKEKGAPVDQLISMLEAYNRTEINERWMYELAELYHRAGRSEDCIRTCDNIMLMFGFGEYVEKAMVLKTEGEGVPLSEYQQSLIENKAQLEEKLKEVEEKEDILPERALYDPANTDIPHNLDKQPDNSYESKVYSSSYNNAEAESVYNQNADLYNATENESNNQNNNGSTFSEGYSEGDYQSESPQEISSDSEAFDEDETDRYMRELEERERLKREIANIKPEKAEEVDNVNDIRAAISIEEDASEEDGPSVEYDIKEPVTEEPVFLQKDAPELYRSNEDTKQEAIEDVIEEVETLEYTEESYKAEEADKTEETEYKAAEAADAIAEPVENTEVKDTENETAEQETVQHKAEENTAPVYNASEDTESKVPEQGAAQAEDMENKAEENTASIYEKANDIDAVAAENKEAEQETVKVEEAAKQQTEEAPVAVYEVAEGAESKAPEQEAVNNADGPQISEEQEAKIQFSSDSGPESAMEDEFGVDIIELDDLDELLNISIIESKTPEKGLNDAVLRIKKAHEISGRKNQVIKIKARKLNEKGVKASFERIGDKDLIVEEAGDLTERSIGDLINIFKELPQHLNIVFIDNHLQVDRMVRKYPEFVKACGINPELYLENSESFINDYAEDSDRAARDEYTAVAASDYNEAAYQQPEQAAAEKVEDTYETEELSTEAFSEYASQYAAAIDCVISGKSMNALLERAEMLEADGMALTRKNAEALIEAVADKAEKPPLFKRLFGVFSPKYNKEGLLILKEEHFLS